MENTLFSDIVWFTCPFCNEIYDTDYINTILCPVCGNSIVEFIVDNAKNILERYERKKNEII